MSSALAGNRDIFVATGALARSGGNRNRARYLIRIEPVIGAGLVKLMGLAIGPRGRGAAALTAGETLIDAIAVGLISDDKDLAVGEGVRN